MDKLSIRFCNPYVTPMFDDFAISSGSTDLHVSVNVWQIVEMQALAYLYFFHASLFLSGRDSYSKKNLSENPGRKSDSCSTISPTFLYRVLSGIPAGQAWLHKPQSIHRPAICTALTRWKIGYSGGISPFFINSPS